MAYKRLVLPPLKLTQRSTFDSSTVKSSIYRGNSEQKLQLSNLDNSDGVVENQNTEEPLDDGDDAFGSNDVFTAYSPDSPGGGSTLHELQCKSNVAGWEAVRKEILTAVIETQAMPPGQLCITCKCSASCRCQRCGPLGFFCLDCFQEQHKITNVFHVGEKWEVGYCCMHELCCT